MDFLKRNWAKFTFAASIILLGLVGYRLYLDIQLRSKDDRVNAAVENVQETLNRKPSTSRANPSYASRLNEQWAPLQRPVSDKVFLMYMPPLVRPVLDREPEVTCTFPGISNLQLNGGVGQVELRWEFQQLQKSENKVKVSPGEVVIQRRKTEDDEWINVSSFSGTEQNKYTDTGVEPRTRYEYRLLVKRGEQKCEEGEYQTEEKVSSVVPVDVKSDIELVFKSAGGDSALILIRKLKSGDQQNKEQSFWIDVGDSIEGEGGFNTPYTLTDVQTNAEYSYLTLTEKTVWKNDKKLQVGKIGRQTLKLPRIIYKDNKGKVYREWQPMDDPTNLYPRSNPPPWQALSEKYDGFHSTVEDLPWGEIPPDLRVDLSDKDATSDGEEGAGNETEPDSSESDESAPEDQEQ